MVRIKGLRLNDEIACNYDKSNLRVPPLTFLFRFERVKGLVEKKPFCRSKQMNMFS